MKSLLTVRQKVEKSRWERGEFSLSDHEVFRQAGLYSVNVGLSGLDDWQGLHQWCQQQFGTDHYTWTGSVFWFENEQDAVLFTLRWSC